MRQNRASTRYLMGSPTGCVLRVGSRCDAAMAPSPVENWEDREDWEEMVHRAVVPWWWQRRCDAAPGVTAGIDLLMGRAMLQPRETWFRSPGNSRVIAARPRATVDPERSNIPRMTITVVNRHGAPRRRRSCFKPAWTAVHLDLAAQSFQLATASACPRCPARSLADRGVSCRKGRLVEAQEEGHGGQAAQQIAGVASGVADGQHRILLSR